MKINQITIRNILGIRELEIKPGEVTEIAGRNGSGKSSVLGAIRAALGVSEFSPAQLIHKGEETAEVVLVLDDGTTVHRRIKANGTDVKVTDAEGMRYQKPQTVLDSLYAITQVNPLRLLATDKKSRDERTKAVLECIPLNVSREKVQELTPQLKAQIATLDVSRHGLDVLADIEKRVFERRTDVNRDLKKASANAESLRESLPPQADGDGTDIVTTLQELREKKALLDQKREVYFTEFEATRRQEREQAMKDYVVTVEEAEFERQAAIAEATRVFEAKRKQATDLKDELLQRAEDEFEANRSAKQRAYEERLKPITKEMARLEEQSRNEAATAAQRKLLGQLTKDVELLTEESERLTESIERVRAYRLEMTSTFPIPGLEITDGEVHYEGIHFDQLNTAKRIQLAVELAALKAGNLGVICVDGCEALDAETFEQLVKACQTRGLQMICTRVAEQPLTINATVEAAA